METVQPILDEHYQSNVPGLYLAGDIAGAPVVKLAMEQGCKVAQHIASTLKGASAGDDALDVLVIGAGAAGLSAALEAQKLGLRVSVIEKGRIGNTIAELPFGKWIYTEPNDRPAVGDLPLRETTNDEVAADWEASVRASGLPVYTGEALTSLERLGDGTFRAVTTKRTQMARRVVLAVGKSSAPRKLGVPGEDLLPKVQHKLYNPNKYQGERIVVVGGGNSAIEAAISLATNNEVLLSYRGSTFHRLSKENLKRLGESNVKVRPETNVTAFGPATCTINGVEERYDRAFVLIGSDAPYAFLRSLGIRFEGDWPGRPWIAAALTAAAFGALAMFAGQSTPWLIAALVSLAVLLGLGIRGDRWALLGFMFVLCYTIYGAKKASGHEFWPYTGWGANTLTFFQRPWSFWYTIVYTGLMTVFGIQAMKRWGFDRRDSFQIWRYVSLLGFQWVFFFLIPEFLFRWAVEYQWIGERLAADPNFAQNAWRSYGLVYAWPLFFYTFFGSPNQVWIVWGVLLSFVLIPVLVLFHGKRYCSWICGCGGLAETLGDRWRHLTPKGPASIRWERMNIPVLVAAVAITVLVLAGSAAGAQGLTWYNLVADTWLVGILPVTLYPFFGGKVWCRYWCPLAKMMEIFSKAFTRMKASRFAIHSNDKCIACGECSRYCQVGIDVMQFALKQERLDNANSSCIGCGICVTVCPMNVLSFAPIPTTKPSDLVQIKAAT
jgi:NosR/NirI family transcriptional regulator, nitrous oxide reductase regulator